MNVPVAPVRSCKLAVVIERGLARTTAPDGGGRYPRRRLTINTGPPSRSSTTSGTSSAAALFDDLIELAELAPGARLLEIGCASGKATLPLAKRGFVVVCVEIGVNLAERARASLAGYPVEVHVAPFESWEGEAHSFDLVYAATAWHWIDPRVRYRRAHTLLRPDGHLAFWSAVHAFPADVDPFVTEIQAVYNAIGESHEGEWPPPPPDETPDDAAEIETTGLFEHIQVRRYVWATRYTAEEYIALLEHVLRTHRHGRRQAGTPLPRDPPKDQRA